MYSCPHCSVPCYTLWRRLGLGRRRPIVCPNCGGLARISDKTRIAEALGVEVLAIAFLVSVFVWSWWIAAFLAAGLVVGFIALLDLVFPLVAAERLGSAAYNRRAAIHFWLLAPLSLLFLIAICFAIFGG
jgi:hypothetical protein